MAEYINREALTIENLEKYMTVMEVNTKEYGRQVVVAVDDLMYLPIADVAEVRHGEWTEDGYYGIPCVCSCCGAEAQYTSTFEETFDYDWEENLCSTGYEETREYIRTPFCPNCGAKMDGKEIGED